MAFLVIIHVPDRDHARAVAERYSAGDVGRVVGLFRWTEPRKTCNGFCDAGKGWTRDITGRVIHCCGGVHPDWKRRVFHGIYEMLGRNLLRHDRTPPTFRNPD
jgi:hypothetical protein